MGGADHDDLAYNPFADDDPVTATLDTAFYSSALNPKHVPKPTVRRRKSSGGDSLSRRRSKKHERSQTDLYVGTGGSSSHPLRSAALNSALHDVEITRPHLSRAVKTGTLVDAPAIESNDLPASPTKDEEKDVLVHEIAPKDSLAGVSLKYGISLPELRRANHLWASDSVHLRKVLYIPIDKASRAREYIPETSLISFTPDTDKEPIDPISLLPAEENIEHNNSPYRHSAEKRVAVIRMPAAQLSFFPPPSGARKASSMNSVQPSDVSTYPTFVSTSTTAHSRYTSFPASNSFTSFLTALPIAASTRDDIIQRLSLDSVSSSFSDSYRSDSELDEGHELNDVTKRIRRIPSLNDPDTLDDSNGDYFHSLRTPKASFAAPSLKASGKSPDGHAAALNTSLSRRRRPLLSTSPPPSYIPQSQDYVSIRTIQMEPSPTMVLPTKSKSMVPTKPLGGSSSGNTSTIMNRRKRSLLDGNSDVELENARKPVSG
ncbi:hypothetical protein BDQ17DRAFT_1234215 [Cyathus striatus]|nr:hypothetical protein BDQ17DRAFT_1234215 [Cyathus striatus]